MKLKEWIYANHKYIYKGDLVWRTHARGLYVVGECRDCKHYEMGDEERQLGACNLEPDFQDPVIPSYGCIHWKPKIV